MTATNQKLLGVVAATPLESRIFTKATPKHSQYVLSVSGIGTDNARRAATELIHKGVTHLLSFGFAGALNPNTTAGTIIIPDTVSTQDEDSFNLSSNWHDAITNNLQTSIGLETGTLLETSYIAITPTDKAKLLNSFSADYVDMESGAIAAIALHAAIPFLVVRVISDEANDTLPKFVKHIGQTRQSWLKMFTSLINHPGDLRYLPKLLHNYRQAHSALTRAVGITSDCLFAGE